ncbi:Methyl farnesoate epoxidase [Orchesella cincta]|uniref:Methyl farnesoate epoxidase n=1 Tax=Orchesella cincta TaxID=48709 RepID=A0A1D2N0Y1_ORCCI|nr:Methyl farnesoate epoxidase [Orchesella cincta]
MVPAIVISDHKLLKELFSHPAALGKAQNPVFTVIGGKYGIVNAEGQVWEEQRKFAFKKLRELGLTNSSIELPLLEEAKCLLSWFEKRINRSITGCHIFNGPVVNIIWNVISGKRSEWEAEEEPELIRKSIAVFRALNKTIMSGLAFAPSLRHVAPGIFGWTDWVNTHNDFEKLMDKETENHAVKLDPSNPMDLIDHYLLEIKKTTDPSSSFYKEDGEQSLRAMLVELFLAGSETVANTLSYTLLYLSHFKDAQARVQQEIDDVIGDFRTPSLTDKKLMPYVEAVILETLRCSSILPLGSPHRMVEDLLFHGYFLPKGATVIASLYAIHHDPNVWGEDAETFRPERFLNKEMTSVVRHDALMPFGSGKRICLGEQLATNTLFLFLTSIYQKFDISPAPDSQTPDFGSPPAILKGPMPFSVVMKLRNADK